MPNIIKSVTKLMFWLVAAYAAAWLAYALDSETTVFWVVFAIVLALGVAVEFGVLRFFGMTALVVAILTATASAASGATTAASNYSSWFGGYTVTPQWNAGDLQDSRGCRDINVWHTGRAVGVVDYEFHLYVHWCWAQGPDGYWRFTNVRIRTSFTHEGATAHYDGVYQKTNNYYTCLVGYMPGANYEKRGCLHIIRKAQVTHHLPALPGVSIAVGHPVVAVDIHADGTLGFWPYYNESQY